MKTIEEEIIEKKWQTKKNEALKAKPLAKKLRNIVGAMGISTVVEKAKVTRLRKEPLGSGVMGTGSQMHSQASTRVQSGVQTGRRSNVQKSSPAFALPSKKRAPRTKADAAPRSNKKSSYPRRNYPPTWCRRCLSFLRPLALGR